MRKIACLLILFLATSTVTFSQSKSGYRIQNGKSSKGAKSGRSTGSSDWLENVFFQPSFGFAFGSGSLYLNLSPTIGYRILEGWDAGIGFAYTYSKYEERGIYRGYNSNTIGGNIFTRYLIKAPFFVMAQYENMGTKYNFDPPQPANVPEGRIGYDAFLAGGGIMQPVGRNGAFIASVLYNFNYDEEADFENGPYSSPYAINVGFMIGF